MVTVHSEVERKYAADDDDDVPALTQLATRSDAGAQGAGSTVVDGDVVRYELSATYFDTADLRLAAAGITLRRRTGGDDAGWHLKLPAGAGARTEVRLPLGRATRTVPASLRRMVRARTDGEPLRPVATIATDRTVRRLVDPTGQVLVELADDRVKGQRLLPLAGGGDASVPVTWRELELELVEGRPELLEHLDAALRDRGLRDSPTASKLRRVLGTPVAADGSGADRPTYRTKGGAAQLRRSSPGGEVIAAYLGAQVDQIHRQDLPVRLDAPDSIHKMRVATRRLRSALSTFRPLVDRSVTDPLREELKWLATELGRARDAEVMRDRLHAAAEAEEGAAADRSPVDTVDAELGGEYRTAHDAVLAELDGERYHALLGALRDLVESPPFTPRASRPARKVLTKPAGRSWSKLRTLMERADQVPGGAERDEVLHEARKAAKRARYAGEALAPAFGAHATAFAAAMEDLQEVLGEHQDSVVTRRRLHQLAAEAPTNEAAFVYGRLHALEETRAGRGQDDVRDAWVRARRGSLRDWLA